MISIADDGARDLSALSTLGGLMDLQEEHFVRGAYRALLGRDPDPEGLGNYLEKLRSGSSKVDILTELRDSGEGSSAANRGRGLSRALARLAAPPAAVSLAGLMDYHGRRFVCCAYRTLLGRDPDSDEMMRGVRQLADGVPRIAIVAHLRLLPECRPREAVQGHDLFRDVDLEIRRFRWSRFPLIGPLVSRWYDVEDDSPASRRVRCIENRLHSLSEDLGVHVGVKAGQRPSAAGSSDDPVTESSGRAPQESANIRLAGARPARVADALLCTLPYSEHNSIDGQGRPDT